MNCKDILVSVIMCVYNTPQDYLNEAVQSILGQTHDNFELLIVDDHSDSDLYQSGLFKDKRITIIKNDANYGPAYSRNRALDIAKGKYIAIMDSDDISLPNRLEEQIKFMEENANIVACGTWFQHFGAKTNIVKKEIDDNEYYRCCLLFGNSPTLLNPSAMIRRDTLLEGNIRYDEELRFGEDYKMWVELSQLGIVTNIHQVLVKYRIHDGQVTKDNAKKRQSLSYDAKVKLMQLNMLGKDFSKDERDMFVSYFGDKKVDPIKYYNLLKKISVANKTSQTYDQEKLDFVLNEQWERKLLTIRNPFLLLKVIAKIKEERKHICLIKRKQLKRKFSKSNEYNKLNH